MIKEFLPAMRGLITHELARRGRSQSRISNLMGVTQAAISQYLSREEEYYLARLRHLGVGDSDSVIYIEALCEDLNKSRVEAVQTLYSIWRRLLSEGGLCEDHPGGSSSPNTCDVCTSMMIMSNVTDSSHTAVEMEEILRRMSMTVRKLEQSPTFPLIMPEVSVNLVTSTPDGRDGTDIAGIPGRIVKVKGRARGTLPPEFGSSHHMARVLLAARRKNRDVKSAINLKHDKKMISILKKLGVRFMFTQMSKPSGDDPILDSILILLHRTARTPDCIVERGGPGIEPILYLFGKSPEDLIERTLQIASRYAKAKGKGYSARVS